MDTLKETLKELAEVECGRSLRELTTLRIGGHARFVVYPHNIVSLDGVMRVLARNGVRYKMIGKGSDLLCSDRDYDGAVIKLDRFFDDTYYDGNVLTAQAGCSIIACSVEAMKRGLSGLEFASGIPGTVGGAVFMNAGAYRSSICDVLQEVLVMRDGHFEWLSAAQCAFSYRSSIFQKHPDWIILAARFALTPRDKDEIAALMDNRRTRRVQSQPLNKPSCGSVFRNPENGNAWALIDGIGYRGHACGGAQVSEKHCNFIINNGNASAEDYLQLVTEIQQKVKEKYGVDLQTEVEKFNWE
ncbi:UDP-N-acetylmuramate dehydrogenase [Stecheria sp. CLA-KB-P133]|uniref:UDP-N-acetylenolpyruvoylglucosamine reductase n=1 Tax=Grylomicrobium aquisgranensis TaxID=2926318 RepID=A0AB35U3Q3_9FIRM|nr:UDP-N-acetylmuramate dehydrogenase [Stecheria sp. CLA-KB-P133]